MKKLCTYFRSMNEERVGKLLFSIGFSGFFLIASALLIRLTGGAFGDRGAIENAVASYMENALVSLLCPCAAAALIAVLGAK